MNKKDAELIEIARELIKKRFIEGRHHIAAALRTRSGQIFSGVHVEVYVGRITVCGEAVAIGAAATAGDTDIESIVAVDETGRIVSPCGMCREMIADYSPQADVIILKDNKPQRIKIAELLPFQYEK
ncbi:MAG TPA: cytidine deaminase [Caldithrix abyssi]|uniref:Cytidine deaminase n=1 Tax=Caldithrix abyssi TaxID=187145 RepID=A0A7V4WUL3_CALAY|nr:cytidine deaminase [Caldithrix abyssi]